MAAYPESDFASWYTATIEQETTSGYLVREPFWSQALAVGSDRWVAGLLPKVRNARVEPVEEVAGLQEAPATYAIYAPKRDRADFWRQRKR